MTWLRHVLLYSLIFAAHSKVCGNMEGLADDLTAFHHFQNAVFNSALQPAFMDLH